MKSLPEMLFMSQCATDLAELPEREYVFARPRRWRADFAFVQSKVLVEIEGGLWTRGRHVRPLGFENDARKSNAAVLLGWRVLRFSSSMVQSGEAIAFMRQVLPLAERVRRNG